MKWQARRIDEAKEIIVECSVRNDR